MMPSDLANALVGMAVPGLCVITAVRLFVRSIG